MNNFTLLFKEYIVKAITMTEQILEAEFSANINFENFTDNRDRLLSVINQISEQINWNEVEESDKVDFSSHIDYLKKLDEKLIVKLQTYQEEVRKEIETTSRQKDNIKGYNLSDVK